MDVKSSPVLEWSSLSGNTKLLLFPGSAKLPEWYTVKMTRAGRDSEPKMEKKEEAVCHKGKGQSSSQCTTLRQFIYLFILNNVWHINPKPLFETICPLEKKKGHAFGLCLLSPCPMWMHFACTLKCSQQAFPLRRFAEPDWISFECLTTSSNGKLVLFFFNHCELKYWAPGLRRVIFTLMLNNQEDRTLAH